MTGLVSASKMLKAATAAFALPCLLFSPQILAEQAPQQFSPPSGFHEYGTVPTTINELRARGYDGQPISMVGRLTAYYGRDKYEFTDQNGDLIEVELDNDLEWSHISKDQLIIIEGIYEVDFFASQIEVKSAQAAPQQPHD